jgi:hypothetical protein
LLDLFPQRRSAADGLAKDVSHADRLKPEPLLEQPGLRPFSTTRGAEENESHGNSPLGGGPGLDAALERVVRTVSA